MNLSRMLTAVTMFCLVSSPVVAGDFAGLPVKQIILKDDRGNTWPDPGPLLPLLNVQPGDAFSSRAIDAGIKYLYLKGLFRDVLVRAFPETGGVRLEYTLVPLTIVERVDVSGRHAVPKDRIQEIVGKLEGKEYREDKLSDVQLDIMTLYQAEGYYDARVLFRTEPADEPNRVALRVDITESEPTLIEDIFFLGNTVFSREQLLAVMKSRKGKPLRRDLLMDTDQEAILKLYGDAGYPAAKLSVVNIRMGDRKAFVTLSIDEGPKVTVTFAGNRVFSAKKLRQSLLLWSEHDVSDAAIDASADKISARYRQRGYADVKVEVKKQEGPGTLALEFVIVEGPRVTVEKILFTGNTVFSAKDLKKEMSLKESSRLSSRPNREDLLKKDVEVILDRYLGEGYLDAVVDATVARSPDGKKAIITIMITEGTQSKVGSVSVQGNTVFSTDQLVRELSLKVGMPYSYRMMEQDALRIQSFYASRGYQYAKVDAQKTVQDIPVEEEGTESAGTVGKGKSRKTMTLVDLRYRITEGERVFIGKIILRGNERTKDYVIMRELLIKPGDPYNAEAIQKSQQRIHSLGYFGMVRFETLDPGEEKPVKDLLLTVEERPAGAVEFGFGYGNLDRLRGFAGITYSNLWGTARSAGLRVEGSDIIERVAVIFKQPWLLGTRLDNRLILAWSNSTMLNAQTREVYYRTRKTTAAFGVEKPFGSLKSSLIYQYQNVDNYDVRPGAALSPQDSGWIRISSLTPGLVLDLRDDQFNPRKGSLHGIALQEAMSALGSQADFSKLLGQTSWFFPVPGKTVFALSARAGVAWPFGGTTVVPINERFYLGGATTVRGYLEDSLGPKSLTGIPKGGQGMAVFNAELRIPVVDPVGLVLFTDAGNVWEEARIHLNDLKATYGAGIRYNTPVGPLRVDYGRKINPTQEDIRGQGRGRLYFSIGQAF